MYTTVSTVLFIILTTSLSKAEISIAIIGGGIGGASTAYFLNEMKQNEIDIDLYEADTVGGRLAIVEYEGHYYEIGGSIIHSKNLLMKQFVKKFGLKENVPCSESFGIFEGKKMLFKSSYYDFVTALKLWWRYGSDVILMNGYSGDMLNTFSRLYDLEKCSSCPFDNTADLLGYAGQDLLDSLNVSTHDGLKKKGLSELFINEFISCILRCNYCQSLDIHLFVGSVAVAGAGSNLWSVKGGNWQVAANLIKASEAVYINERVRAISSVKGQSQINVSTSTGHKLYDYVVIATPLTKDSDITFHGFDGKVAELENFHSTYCTIIEGEINEGYFDLDKASIPDTMLFTKKYHFNAISKVNPVDYNCDESSQVWKIFSDAELSDTIIGKLFNDCTIIYVKHWLAYPEYDSIGKNKSFYLFEDVTNVLYVNAIEALASAMEMSALGGRNVASLIMKNIFIKNNPNKSSNKTLHDEF